MKLKSDWSRARAIGIAFLFIFSAFAVLLGGGASSVKATTGTYTCDPVEDGFIYHTGATYPPYTTTAVFDNTDIAVGQDAGPYTIYRGYVSFNTSAIPDDAVILSAELRLRAESSLASPDTNIRVYRSDYTDLNLAPWNATGSLEGTLLNAGSWVNGAWFSMSVGTSRVNLTGNTTYMLNSTKDGNSVPTGSDFVLFYSADSTSSPELIIYYAIGGTVISIILTTGSYLNSTAYPTIHEYNLTYDLWEFDIDTVPNALNVTITKQITWTFQAVTPAVNYTDTSTYLELQDVFDSICYRVWLTVPKNNPFSTIHLSLYNAFTGEGFFWEQMRVQICDGSSWDNTTAEIVARPDFPVEPDSSYTLRVLDYFGNALIDYSFTANAQDVFVSIPVPVYSWQIFNMNDAPVLMRIYWNNSGAPWEFFVGPHWQIERWLKGGDYTFMTTFYDSNGTAGATVYFNRTVPMTGLNASFIYVQGTTLYEIISSVEGVMATQQIITNLISPSVVLIYEDLPLAPVRVRNLALTGMVVIDPYLILEATTYQNQTGVAGTNTSLLLPHAQVIGSTYYNIADTLTFSGTFATDIYINDTAGTNLYNNNVLPAAVVLNGENVTVWGNNNYSVSRTTTFREVSDYTINYYATQRKYETTVSLNNSCPFDYHSPYWYISFPSSTVIDQDTVTLYDLDNSVYLSQRTNFDVTTGGVHVTLTQLNSSDARNFRLTFWDENGTTGIGAPNLIAESYTDGSLNGIPMKYTAVQWTNPWSVAYSGEVYISLNFSDGDNILQSSLVIIDETTGLQIPNQDFVYTGRTILILTSGVGSVPVGGARNYGIYFTLDAAKAPVKSDFFFGPLVWNGQQFWVSGVAISLALILIIVIWIIIALAWWNEKDWAGVGLVMAGSLTVIIFYFSRLM